MPHSLNFDDLWSGIDLVNNPVIAMREKMALPEAFVETHSATCLQFAF
jgi:hypothetical protein